VQYLTSRLGTAGASYTTIALGGVLVGVVLLFRRGLAPALSEGIGRLLRLGTAAIAGRK